MTLTDTGPLVAIGLRSDPDHRNCVSALRGLPTPMVITLPVLTESLYLLHKGGGWIAQDRLLQQIDQGAITVINSGYSIVARARELMARYKDHPMDFADASLILAAEASGLGRIFTLDSHFRAFRLDDGSVLDVVP